MFSVSIASSTFGSTFLIANLQLFLPAETCQCGGVEYRGATQQAGSNEQVARSHLTSHRRDLLSALRLRTAPMSTGRVRRLLAALLPGDVSVHIR
jgi:hypothetical protein